MEEKLGIFDALAAAQAEFPHVAYDATGKVRGETKSGKQYEYEYEYATLANIVAAIRPALNKHGLFLTQDVWTADDGVAHCIRTRLLHKSGQTFESGVMFGRPLAGGMQAVGGVVSYLRRYQLTAFLGLSVGEKEDDDGAREEEVKTKSDDRRNGSSGGVEMPREKAQEPKAQKEQKQEAGPLLTDGAKTTLRAAMTRVSVDDEKLKVLTGYTVDEMPFAELNGAMKTLREQAK